MDKRPHLGTPPTAAGAGHRLSVNEMYEMGTTAREKYWSWKRLNLGSYYSDPRYSEDPAKYFRYELQPLGVMLPFGTIGLILLGGNFFLHSGLWMHGRDDYTGLLRMVMIFVGAFCIFMAWPRYRDMRITPKEEVAQEARIKAAREHIAQVVAGD